MQSAFDIIAEPNRRAILSLLITSERSVGDIERRLRMSQPTVSKHLRVLRDAGFVEVTVDAQRRLYRLRPEPFKEVQDWLTQLRRFWSKHLEALDRMLKVAVGVVAHRLLEGGVDHSLARLYACCL